MLYFYVLSSFCVNDLLGLPGRDGLLDCDGTLPDDLCAAIDVQFADHLHGESQGESLSITRYLEKKKIGTGRRVLCFWGFL